MNEQTIIIGDKSYPVSELQEEAQAILGRIQALHSQQRQLQMQLIETERAINGWADDIKNSIQQAEEAEEAEEKVA